MALLRATLKHLGSGQDGEARRLVWHEHLAAKSESEIPGDLLKHSLILAAQALLPSASLQN
jgi:hypothetical protein